MSAVVKHFYEHGAVDVQRALHSKEAIKLATEKWLGIVADYIYGQHSSDRSKTPSIQVRLSAVNIVTPQKEKTFLPIPTIKPNELFECNEIDEDLEQHASNRQRVSEHCYDQTIVANSQCDEWLEEWIRNQQNLP